MSRAASVADLARNFLALSQTTALGAPRNGPERIVLADCPSQGPHHIAAVWPLHCERKAAERAAERLEDHDDPRQKCLHSAIWKHLDRKLRRVELEPLVRLTERIGEVHRRLLEPLGALSEIGQIRCIQARNTALEGPKRHDALRTSSLDEEPVSLRGLAIPHCQAEKFLSIERVLVHPLVPRHPAQAYPLADRGICAADELRCCLDLGADIPSKGCPTRCDETAPWIPVTAIPTST